jgi:hypothetical protein
VPHESIAAGARAPLSREQRSALPSGQGWLNLLAPHYSPIELVACATAGAAGLVYVQQRIEDGDGFTPDEARQVARALLELADHAEYGPGEWHKAVWHPERRHG